MAGSGGGGKKPWVAPALGYPPHVTPMHHSHFRPLHVWGHPTWPKHKPSNLPSTHRTYPIPAVAGAPSSWPGHPPYWHQQPLYPQSNESIDAAIGDVITKPWLPLPLGLKPPSVDGVMTELQRQGVANVPPLP